MTTVYLIYDSTDGRVARIQTTPGSPDLTLTVASFMGPNPGNLKLWVIESTELSGDLAHAIGMHCTVIENSEGKPCQLRVATEDQLRERALRDAIAGAQAQHYDLWFRLDIMNRYLKEYPANSTVAKELAATSKAFSTHKVPTVSDVVLPRILEHMAGKTITP